MSTSDSQRRRPFQFSLKRLFIAVTIIAILFGAWVLSPGERQRRAVRRIEHLGGHVDYEAPELSDSPLLFPTLVLRACLPRDYFDPVIGVSLFGTRARDADMQSLQALTHLQIVTLNQTFVTDKGLLCLRHNSNLALVFIGDTKITDEGVVELKKSIPTCDVREK